MNRLDLSGYLAGYDNGKLSTDKSGYFYLSTWGSVRKFDKLGGLITNIGQSGTADGQFQGANSVSSNIAGDTLWITDLDLNRVSIFIANFRKATVADSLALVDLYNSTNGPGWTTKTNWLTGTVDTWYGVGMSGGKIRDISLPNNLLKGTLPASLTTLDNILTLDLHNNKLSGGWPDWSGPSAMSKLDLSANLFSGSLATLPAQLEQVNLSNNKLTAVASLPAVINVADLSNNKLAQLGNMTATDIDTLKVENNNLAFGDLEPNITIAAFTYSPQDTVDVFESVLEQVNSNYTFSAALSGTANAYQWKKNGTAISGATNPSITFPNITFADDATYTYAATNSIVTGLTLLSHKKVLRVSSLQRDSIALVAFFNSTNGSGWTNNNHWVTTPLGTGNWFGVSLLSNRVVAVNLPGNKLSGVVPAVFADIQELTAVDLSSNKIKSIPDLTTIPGLVTLNVSNNALDFASLIANVGINGINYPNQDSVGVKIDTLVNYGTDFNISISTKGGGNVYQWTRNGVPVTGATDTTFLISAINRKNMGTYVCEVTNPAVPLLTLTSRNKRVQAVAKLSGKFVLPDSTTINKADILLFKINPVGKYDTTLTKAVLTDGTFVLDKVVLDDYELLGKPDTIAFPTALPTFYKSTIFWEVADTLNINGDRSKLDIVAVTKPTPPKGTGSISGTLEDDTGSTSGGREESRVRVEGAGVSASRVVASGRTEAKKYILVAYTQTDENGEFELDYLLPDNYSLNIQYPGYPMDTTSFINFTIGTLPSSKQVIVDAAVEGNKIVVRLLKITGLEDEDNRFSIYPNPTKLFLNVDLNAPIDNVEYEITTIQGQKVKTGKLSTVGPNRIDVSALSGGVYVVDLVSNDKVIKSFRIVLE